MRVQGKDDERRTLWSICVPADCKHFMALQENSAAAREEESLFPPYSAFKVKSNRRDTMKHYHDNRDIPVRVICLEALVDNLAPEAQNAPTAPWY
jgi:hypothetical protein